MLEWDGGTVGAAEEMASFGELLTELKQRSGLSYGTLAKRLHMSASTLHRYCNGDAVPAEYTSMERFARLCKATPEELIELHRRWVLADAARRRERRAAGGVAGAHQQGASPTDGAVAVPGQGAEPALDAAPVPPPETRPEHGPRPAARQGAVGKRRALLATVTFAVLAASAGLTAHLLPGDEGRQAVGAASTGGGDAATPDLPRPSASPSTTASASASPTASRAAGRQASPSTGKTATDPADASAPTPLTVATRPDAWEHPCGQFYLVNRPPAKVPPPPTVQDAPGWVRAMEAVSAGSQRVELTVQGTGEDTVVLQALHVHVVDSRAPLAHNAYEMGVGCGGGVPTKTFSVDLDASRPQVTPKSGQRDFPYKVSETDPEVFYITAQANSRDVRWYLELRWSSGTRQGRLRIDNHGEPFRTSSMRGRPEYGYYGARDVDGEWLRSYAD
jgi:plasmid maintenance system antidote protein VapI